MTLFFAGTDTTATLINTSLYLLGEYPEIQKQIREEISAVVDGEVKHENLNKLPLLSAFLNETFRFEFHRPISKLM